MDRSHLRLRKREREKERYVAAGGDRRRGETAVTLGVGQGRGRENSFVRALLTLNALWVSGLVLFWTELALGESREKKKFQPGHTFIGSQPVSCRKLIGP